MICLILNPIFALFQATARSAPDREKEINNLVGIDSKCLLG